MIEEREETVVDLGEGEAEIRQTPIEHLLFPSPSFQSATFSRSSNVQTFWRSSFPLYFIAKTRQIFRIYFLLCFHLDNSRRKVAIFTRNLLTVQSRRRNRVIAGYCCEHGLLFLA